MKVSITNLRYLSYLLAVILSGLITRMAFYRPCRYMSGNGWFFAGVIFCSIVILILESSVSKVSIVNMENPSKDTVSTSSTPAVAGMSNQIVYALAKKGICPYAFDSEGKVLFKYMNRRTSAAFMDGTLKVATILPFDEISLCKRLEVSMNIRRIDGLHVVQIPDSEDLECIASVPIPSNLDDSLSDVLEKRIRPAVYIFEELALIPANEIRRNTAAMVVKTFLNEEGDVGLGSIDVSSDDCCNPFYDNEALAEEFSDFLSRVFDIDVLPMNFTSKERLKSVLKCLSVYCRTETTYLVARRIVLEKTEM